MKRKQVLAIDAISSVLVVENEEARADEGGSPRSEVTTYVMRRYNVGTWSEEQVADAVDAFDRIIDLEPPARHLLKHHSVTTQRGHVNLVVSYCPAGSLAGLCAELRERRLGGAAGASRHHDCCFAPSDARAWFLQAATAVSHLHGQRLVHGNPRLSALLCADAPMSASEDGLPSATLSPPLPPPHVADRYRLASERSPDTIATHFPPEVRAGQAPSFAGDVWLLGDLLVDLVLAASPASPFALDELPVTAPEVKAAAIGDAALRQYVRTMMHPDPARRPTVAEVLAAVPLLNWSAAVSSVDQNELGDETPAKVVAGRTPQSARSGSGRRASRSGGRSQSAGREASRQPASPHRNMSPNSPRRSTPGGDFPTPVQTKQESPSPARPLDYSPAPERPHREALNAARAQDRAREGHVQGTRSSTEAKLEELEAMNRELQQRPLGHQHQQPASHGLSSAAPVHRRLRMPVEPISVDTSVAVDDGDAQRPTSARGHQAAAAAPAAAPGPKTPLAGRRRPAAVPRYAPTGGPASHVPQQRASSASAGHRPAARGAPTTSGVAGGGGGPGPVPASYQDMRTMTKAEKMRVLDERARDQHRKAQEYERQRGAQAEADRARQREAEERMRQHKQQMREIKAGRRVSIVKQIKKQNAGPSVEIFVHTPTRAGGVKSFVSEDFDRREPQPSDSGSASPDVTMEPVPAADAPQQRGNATRFFVPLVGGAQGARQRSRSAPKPATAGLDGDAAVRQSPSSSRAPSRANAKDAESARASTVLFTPDTSESEGPATPPPLSDDDHHRSPPSAAQHEARATVTEVELPVTASAAGPAGSLAEPGSSKPAADTSRGLRAQATGGAEPSAAPVARPRLNDDSENSIAIPQRTPVAAPHPEASRVAAPSAIVPMEAAAAAPAARAERPHGATSSEGELVAVVEWNVDLIVRQLRRYMPDPALQRALTLCRHFARGPTETRTNPRANAALMTKLRTMVGDDAAMAECSPLLSQLVALEATLATADQLRAVEASGDYDELSGLVQ